MPRRHTTNFTCEFRGLSMKDTVFYTKKTLNIKGRVLDLKKPLVMGILNMTPDSFYDGGKHETAHGILSQVEKMLQEGAAIIDVGGYSSRPGAAAVSEAEEIRRVTGAITLILKEFSETIISVDTFRSQVAEVSIGAGAAMVNDISGGDADDKMFEVIAKLGIPYILMHMRGTPKTMQSMTTYDNLMGDILGYFQNKVKILQSLGVKDIILDPGFGFAKTLNQNYELLKNLKYFNVLNLPMLVGLSRKSMIYKALDITPESALNGTSILNTIALMNGASILRVHNVKEANEAINLYQKVTT